MCNIMSDVRLSNASPTLERVDPRQPDNVRPPVRRNLFGRPDPEELRRNVAALIQDDVQAFIERYNFDPVEERPLSPHTFEWEEDGDAPEFFRRAPHGNQRPRREADLPGDDNGQDAAERSGTQPDRQRERNGSRKRGAGALGPCSSDGQNKRSHTDDEDDDDDDDENQSKGAGSRAVNAAERPGLPEGSAEVR